ncbi:MAG: bifunctional (p)ppGpp synthetase/guanosine-3',5'-bis(diphosphate) 3'-pyrophosphohydrolase [Oscillospiraceae bacterium]|nr:bifunctional (p)ppGpp synthetase/guanosine-3',5'-bis(diphosphate) 3'-pyrophosphohydrolase [Oscillospiraceae bacterium]
MIGCTIDSLIERITSEGKLNFDLEKIMAAYTIANTAHEGQTRSSGEPFISHPLSVANILLGFNMDTDTIVAALLHDVVEDTKISLSTLEKQFGKDVAHMVDGVTKIGLVPLDTTKEEQHAENIRKILMAMAKDVRVILIKLADRLHNMRTLAARPPDKQRENALETMSFYAPIAHRLGMNSVKEEMEDLSLRYLDPFGFKAIEEQIKYREEERNFFIENKKAQILERIGNMSPTPYIEGRVKGVYSIYKKVIVGGKEFDEIYDIYAVRIIVQSVIECYNILGIIHDMFRPIPFRFKDYIATPKPNRYQSLHTTVMSRESIPFEVQIRTQDMHSTAEYGIAAHWKYKAGLGKQKTKASDTSRLEWIRHILDQQQEAENVVQITESIKTDLATEDVYVFTPKGDIITLPLGANVIDFAYAIHSQVGNKMTGAKVGGRMVSFDYKLETGNIVEIMTTNSAAYGPNRNWLDTVKTNQAKLKIRAWFKKERRPENIKEGKSMLERELKRNSLPFEDELLLEAAKGLRYDNTDDFYAAIGYGGLQLTRVVHRVKEFYTTRNTDSERAGLSYEEINRTIAKRQSKGVLVDGMENCLIRFANCCAPLPGDEILGFITRGYGVSVHKKDCVNVTDIIEKSPERLIKVEWINTGDVYYRAAIELIAEDRTALIADVTNVISHNRLSISEFTGRKLKNGNACIDVALEIEGVEQLNNILAKLKKIPGVIMATRRDS